MNTLHPRQQVNNTQNFVQLIFRSPIHQLEEIVRDLQKEIQRQLSDRQTNDTQLSILELAFKTTYDCYALLTI